MNQRTIAIGIAGILVGACATFPFVGQGFAQKTVAESNPTVASGEAGRAVGRYQGVVFKGDSRNTLYLFDTATGSVWLTVEPTDLDTKWTPVIGPVHR